MKGILITVLGVISATAFASDAHQYNSLHDFCIGTQADTEANCKCGQATADRIMSKDEQAAALAMMQGNRETFQKYAHLHDQITQKMAQISKGCAQTD